MKGMVCSGKGEGKKYIAMNEYKKQIEEKFRFTPYEGTLNVSLDEEICGDLKNIEGIKLQGFKKGDKYFGDVNCFPVSFNAKGSGFEGALLLPARSGYRNVAEIVSGERIRERVRDGDEIFIFFEPFAKKGLSKKFFALSHEGRGEGDITVYYDSPFEEGRRDLCYEKKFGDCYLKRFVARDVASIIFEGNGNFEYKKLLEWIKNNEYKIISPLRKIKYSRLNEWQIEIKIKKE